MPKEMNFPLAIQQRPTVVLWRERQPRSCHQPLAGVPRSNQGFSITELVVVAALISMIVGIAVNNYAKRVQIERLKTGTQSMAAWLDGVRTLAIQQSETCAIRVSANDGRLQLEPFGSQGFACLSNSPDFNLKEASNSTQVVLCASAQGPTEPASSCNSASGNLQIIFTPKGTSPTNALLQTHLASTDQNRCIQLIAPLGLLRIGKVVGGSCNWNTAS
jgi:prepilin-type N-terminal cleavage/methylation domain-containing protein